MTETTTSPDRRARVAAIIGTLFQAAFFGVLLTVGLINQSDVVLAVARWMAGGLLIWPVLALVYGQRHRMLEERREAEEIKRSRTAEGASAIFDTEDEAYLIERRRLAWMLRWLVPGAVVLLAVYHLYIALASPSWPFGWNWPWGASLRDSVWRLTQNRGVTMTFVGGVGFLAFLFSRYTAGMARTRGWRMLRSGASYLAGNALACLIVLIAIGVQNTDFPIAEAIATYAIRITLLVLGIEFVINFILDFYRPRVVGEESRPAFDSRMLALITEPGGIARTIADAINYQFGFEVSSTWFYQLLKRALFPMIAFGLIVLFLLSSVLVIDTDEQAVVERFGRRLQQDGKVLVLGPGLHFKWPWPIDCAYTAPVDRIQSFTIGEAPREEDQYEMFEGRRRLKPILWGEKHEFNAEMMVVLASKQRQLATRVTRNEAERAAAAYDRTAAASLLMISVDIQYRVKAIKGYLYEYIHPQKLVEDVAYQVLTNYAAGVTEDQFLGEGRVEANRILAEKLQSRLDEEDVGIQILFVAVQEAHPSDEVAKSYQEVVKAEIGMEAAVENARQAANTLLTSLAGSRSRAQALDAAILERDRLAQDTDTSAEQLEQAQQQVDALLTGDAERNIAPAGGDAAKRIADATAEELASVTRARGDLTLFQAEVAAYEAAPKVYRMRKYLDMLERATRLIRKYVLVVDPAKHVIVEYEQEEKNTIELDETNR
ncbi:MAG TPA: protease modulator HflK [Phycisphaerae bacterium]|nr:protease modulator HflK [Phycisphaerae bacterium]